MKLHQQMKQPQRMKLKRKRNRMGLGANRKSKKKTRQQPKQKQKEFADFTEKETANMENQEKHKRAPAHSSTRSYVKNFRKQLTW